MLVGGIKNIQALTDFQNKLLFHLTQLIMKGRGLFSANTLIIVKMVEFYYLLHKKERTLKTQVLVEYFQLIF